MRTSDGSVGGDESIRLQRRHLVGRALGLSLLVAGAAATAAAPALAGATTSRQVATANVAGVGRVLVFGHRVLYVHSTDPKRHSTCTGVCATIWPPLVVSGSAAHHLGHVHGLGTIHRPNGRLQVTINGHPLYFFSGDKSLTAAMGQGFLNMWFTVRANGTVVHVAKANSAPAAPAPASTSTTTHPSTTTTQGSHSSGGPMPAPPAPTTTPPTSPPPSPTTTPTTNPPTTTTTYSPPTTTTTAGGGGGVGF
jgi:predicted lipoprotein with Yx(FWY)xxD motif